MTEREIEQLAFQRGGTVGKSMADIISAGANATAGPKRHKTGRMNKLEAAFSWRLDDLKQMVDGIWLFESVKLRLADKTWYTPDFLFIQPGFSMTFYEVKGFMRDDAAVKIKVVARLFPQFRFILVTKDRNTKEWKETLIPAE